MREKEGEVRRHRVKDRKGERRERTGKGQGDVYIYIKREREKEERAILDGADPASLQNPIRWFICFIG